MVGSAALYCAHRTPLIFFLNDPSKLACFPLLEWHPCWSHCGRRARRPLRARAPGARDRHGWHSPFSPCAFCEQEGWSGSSLPFQACPFLSSEGCLLFTRIQRGGWCDLHCAHRATTASPWALCEHRDHASCLATPPPSSPISLHEGRLDGLPLARVQRGLS